MKRIRRLFPLRLCSIMAGGIVLLGASACSFASVGLLKEIGRLPAPLVDEASGLAPSRLEDGVYWVHNDSNGKPLLYALDANGHMLGQVRLKGVNNEDWEDMASFTLGGRAYLLVADIGDNGGKRRNCRIHVFEEPPLSALAADREVEVPIAWSVPVHYPAKAIDAESVAVDPEEGAFYLLTKREYPSILYRFPLRPTADEGTLALQRCGQLASLPQPEGAQATLPIPRGRYSGQPTGMDFAADGRHVVILTYTHLAIYHRNAGESWAATLGRQPEHLVVHDLAQAEAVCFSRDSKSVLVTGEGLQTPLYRWTWDE